MATWLEAFEQLPEDAQARVRTWIELQTMVAESLNVPFDEWIERYVDPCIQHPLDYSFLAPLLGNYASPDMGGPSATFSRDADPGSAAVARIPLRAKNNLGRFSPATQDEIARRLEAEEAAPLPLPPGDVAILQKVFASEKALAQLKRPDFKNVRIRRDHQDMVIAVEGAPDLVRMPVATFSAAMSKPLV